MRPETARRACAPLLAAFTLGALAGCTGLVSERPIFPPADVDMSGALLGHYRKVDDNTQVIVMRGPDNRMTLVGFEVKKPAQPGKPEPKPPADTRDTLVQEFYAEGDVIPLGGGDYVLQLSCSALIHEGKTYSAWVGGKKSPYRGYSAYGIIAQDRMKDYLWVSTNFYSGRDETDLVFNKYAVLKPPKSVSKDYDVRVIPQGTTPQLATAMFRDLISLFMTSADGELYQRVNRDPVPAEDESAAIVLNDSAQCRHVQSEGEPPPN